MFSRLQIIRDAALFFYLPTSLLYTEKISEPKNGYIFLGWALEGASDVISPDFRVDDDLTLYAKWIGNSYGILNLGGG